MKQVLRFRLVNKIKANGIFFYRTRNANFKQFHKFFTIIASSELPTIVAFSNCSYHR